MLSADPMAPSTPCKPMSPQSTVSRPELILQPSCWPDVFIWMVHPYLKVGLLLKQKTSIYSSKNALLNPILDKYASWKTRPPHLPFLPNLSSH